MKVGPEALHEAALSYLDQRDASVAQLRRILARRVARYAPEELRETAHEDIETLLTRFSENGLLDDRRYSQALAESMRRRGDSAAKIKAKLRVRGIPSELTDEALREQDEGSEERSADVYARKRRLTDRYDLDNVKERQKALASLARQGFSFEVAKKVLGL